MRSETGWSGCGRRLVGTFQNGVSVDLAGTTTADRHVCRLVGTPVWSRPSPSWRWPSSRMSPRRPTGWWTLRNGWPRTGSCRWRTPKCATGARHRVINLTVARATCGCSRPHRPSRARMGTAVEVTGANEPGGTPRPPSLKERKARTGFVPCLCTAFLAPPSAAALRSIRRAGASSVFSGGRPRVQKPHGRGHDQQREAARRRRLSRKVSVVGQDRPVGSQNW